jgi:oxalate---CoA ligase
MQSTDAATLLELVGQGAGEAFALKAPGVPALSYAQLRELIAATITSLNERGVGRNDRVAMVLSNGAEMASAFVSLASAATAAPLNPGYKSDEFEFYMKDVGAKALIVEQGSSSAALAVAERLDIPVLRLVPTPLKGAGSFVVEGEGRAGACVAGPAQASDIALILHTSGTTSRPKIVPLSHRNVCVSARSIAQTLELSPNDCGLQIMPCSTFMA